jgi:competence protein ComEC
MGVEGRLAGEPDFRGNRALVWVAVDSLRDSPEAEPWPARGRVRATVLDPDFTAGWGDRVELYGLLSRPAPRSVPGGFDNRIYLANQGAHAQLRVFPGDWRILRPCRKSSPIRWVRDARRRLLNVFDRRLGPHAAALLSGLLLGKKPAGFPSMEEDFRRSGTYHLLVASGSNVGFWVAIWILAGKWLLPLPRRWIWALAIPWAFLYAGLAGADPPVVRAAVMLSFGIAAFLLAREDRVVYAVGLSAGCLLLLRPAALFEAGFQMSYAATLGVILGVPALEAAGIALLKPRGENRRRPLWFLPALWLLRLFLVSVAAQLALSPLLIHYFHRISWIGLVSNMVAVPWAAMCVGFGVALAAFDLLGPFDGPFVAVPALATEWAVTGLWRTARFFSSLPGAESVVVWNGPQIAVWSILVVAVFTFLANALKPGTAVPRFRGAAMLGTLWALGVCGLIYFGRPASTAPLTVTWLDAGLGDAIVVRSPSGITTVVDGGPVSAGRYGLVPYLRRLGLRRVDRVILTHGDPPHAGGLGPLLDEMPVGEFLCAESTWKSRVWGDVRERIERAGIPRRFLEEGNEWEEDGVVWRVLSPAAGENARGDGGGLVLLVRRGRHAALLTADLPPARQSALAGLSGALSVLQWPHHGRVHPDFDFIASGSPQWTVVSGDRSSRFVRSFRLGADPGVTGRAGTLQWRAWDAAAGLKSLAKPEIPVYRLPPLRDKKLL